MRPGVIGDFVAVSNDFFDDFREFADALTDHKKGRVNFALAEHFQEARSIGGVGGLAKARVAKKKERVAIKKGIMAGEG